MGDESPTETRTVAHAPAEAAAPSRTLLVVDGDVVRRVPLPLAGALVLGRAPDADIVVSDASASRRHGRFVLTPESVTVTDLGSHNGTAVNGVALTETSALTRGDTVTFGEVTVLVQEAPAPSTGGPLSSEALTRRLEAEVQRAAAAESPVAVLVVLGHGRAEVTGTLLDVARRADTVGALSRGQAAMVLPDASEAAAVRAAKRVLAALAARGDDARAGVASLPDDGGDAAALLDAARAAAERAPPGEVALARDALAPLAVGERKVIVAAPAMRRVYDVLRRLAPSRLPVLITGETGSGKEDAAYALHAWSPRAGGPFVCVNCASLPESLVESELFGHERGAFTGAAAAKPGLFEAAHGGTLFLDELGELSLAAQAKLLRVLETGLVTRVGALTPRQVDVRVVAATHRDLEAHVEAGQFRQDLFFRLGAARVAIPPLRERPLEIALLANLFLPRAAAALGRPEMALSSAAALALARHTWPGNVRELRSAIDYAAAVADDDVIEPEHLPLGRSTTPPPPPAPTPATPAAAAGGTPPTFRPLGDELRELEERRIREALAATGGRQKQAADLLSVPLRTFATKLKLYGLTRRRDGAAPRDEA